MKTNATVYQEQKNWQNFKFMFSPKTLWNIVGSLKISNALETWAWFKIDNAFKSYCNSDEIDSPAKLCCPVI